LEVRPKGGKKLIGQEIFQLTPKLSTKVRHIRVDGRQRWSIGSGLEVRGVGSIEVKATPTIFHVVNAFVVARDRLASWRNTATRTER